MVEPRVLIIGYGNTLRGDDALGPRAAEELSRRLTDRRIIVRSEPALALELSEPLASSSLAIFVDASLDGPPGEVACRPLSPAAEVADSALHGCGPQRLLDAARRLYGRSPEAHLLSVRGESFELADGRLTAPVAAALEPLIAKVRALIGEHLARFPQAAGP